MMSVDRLRELLGGPRAAQRQRTDGGMIELGLAPLALQAFPRRTGARVYRLGVVDPGLGQCELADVMEQTQDQEGVLATPAEEAGDAAGGTTDHQPVRVDLVQQVLSMLAPGVFSEAD